MTTPVASRSSPPMYQRRRPRARRAFRIIGILGRVFVLGGLTLLLFTAYMLWGTGVYTKQAQREASRALAANPVVTDAELEPGKIPPAKPDDPPALGEPLFSIQIPTIGVDTVVVQGVDQESLRKGIGHFPDCSEGRSDDCLTDTRYPGEPGNVALSGHRTTYGAPFFRLDELQKGDVVDIVSGRARYRYRMREQKIVDPVAGFSTVEQHGRDELTLTTCHPRFSAAQRLIIHADYEGASLISTGSRPTRTPIEAPISRNEPILAPDVLILAGIAVASALGSLGLSRRYRKLAGSIALGLVGSAALWIGVFPRVLAQLPTNY